MLSWESVFEALKNEKKTGEIIPLEAEFYNNANRLVASMQDEQEKSNMVKTINTIKEKRAQKILVYIAYGKQVPAPLPTEEEDLYNQIKRILKKESAPTNQTTIRISADIPEIITTKGSKIGPFRQNEIVKTGDTDNIKFIIDNKIGEII
ncbi:MAG: hypothetical protein KGI00_00715 [Candidatus Micrarchaeota archaeon]|nr:hypothetical protein [Candidatus Micrarchaeota archaeon]MDE1824261.1 hypothetical protein [Candidatus Micrarchaeota archaeon]MDE1849233.1 hypothetical protein [Candidatus Micrarchaeota archaeon]